MESKLDFKINKDSFFEKSSWMKRNDKCQIYDFENETGTGKMSWNFVFDGIYVIYNDFNMKEMSMDVGKQPSIIEINHCREGIIECEYAGRCIYLQEGDFVIASKDTICTSQALPTSHYHGISVVIDFEAITDDTSKILNMFSINIDELRKRTCGGSKCFVIRGNDSIQHIFSELYVVHDDVKYEYLKIKVIELLLFITTIEMDKECEKQQYFIRSQVEIVKEINDFLIENIDKHFTLEELASKYKISLTVMKKCFKGIYGIPIYTYVRNIKIQRAAKMLKETNLKISDIAGMVGYENPSKFSYAFSKIMGKKPLEYRKTNI